MIGHQEDSSPSATSVASSYTSLIRRRPKLGFVGSGNIGSTAALIAGLRHLGDCVLFDVLEGMPQGRALDLSQSTALSGSDVNMEGSTSFSVLQDCDVVVVTAGLPRKPGMSRDDLVGINSKIIRNVAVNIGLYCPNAFVVCITNPLDVMVRVLQEVSGLPHHMVVGMAGVLDSARFRYFLADRLNVSIENVQALVLGGHGDAMVPLPRYTTVAGICLTDLVQMGWITQEEVDAIVDRTRNGGGEIVKLLKTGSAFYSPALCAIQMVEAFLFDKKSVLPCCAYLTGQYGENDIYVGVPVVIGAGGVERIVELQLTSSETDMLKNSIENVRNLMKLVPPVDVEEAKKLGIAAYAQATAAVVIH